jgi:cytochrome c oxidase subunit III
MAATITSPGLRAGVQTHRLGILFALAGIGMLFIALTSAYVVRQGLGTDWTRVPMPRILLVNTAVLLASSITLEKARKAASRNWLFTTLALGLVFLGGQMVAWRQLEAMGLYLSTSPHSSFFYVLTGVHAFHLAGGLISLAYVPLVAADVPRRRARWLDATALYWHFMDALWIYLLVLLFRS